MEELFQIPNFPSYKIAKTGVIINSKTNRVISQTKGIYYNTRLKNKDGEFKTCYLHRLLAVVFVPNPHNYPHVNHIDCDKLNNELTNLEWCTAKQNIQHAWANGLCKSNYKPNPSGVHHHKTSKPCVINGTKYISISDAARNLGVTRQHISGILKLKKQSTRFVIGK